MPPPSKRHADKRAARERAEFERVAKETIRRLNMTGSFWDDDHV